jgi:hypothetical protein
MKKTFSILIALLLSSYAFSLHILIPMDETQKNHLKAYGVAYWVLSQNAEVSWLLNYRGGAFLIKHDDNIERQCKLRGVTYNNIADVQAAQIVSEIAEPEVNMDVVKLQKAPKIAVYSPKNKLPWDDAVTLVLTYAEIPYDVLYDDEILKGDV